MFRCVIENFRQIIRFKYTTRKEEHQLLDVAETKDVHEARVTTENHQHEKIMTCNRLVAKKERAYPRLGREVCWAELVSFDRGLQYIFSSV